MDLNAECSTQFVIVPKTMGGRRCKMPQFLQTSYMYRESLKDGPQVV